MSFSDWRLHVQRFPTAVLVVILVLGACADDGPTQGDTTAPTVSTESPAAGATNVDVTAVVSIAFSEPMNAATITTSTFTLTGPGGGVTGAAALTGNTATFTPAAPLAYLTEYTALVTTGVTDLAGNALAANHAWTFTTGQAELLEVIGDIEGEDEFFCDVPPTLATANSIHVGARVLGTETRTFANLLDVTGSVTPIAFVFDVGGGGVGNVFCNEPGDALETDGITENGPVLHKPWHIEGLTPGGSYTMTFTGGGVGAPRRSMRVFVDVDGNGTIEPGEVEDLIGLDGVVETRTFGQTITADGNGVIIGEYWGGSTNGAGENGAWRGWSIEGFRFAGRSAH